MVKGWVRNGQQGWEERFGKVREGAEEARETTPINTQTWALVSDPLHDAEPTGRL